MSEYILVDGELYHYGVKGMKWGRRKRYNYTDVDRKRDAMKSAKKDYNRSFNKAYNRAVAAYSPIKKHREANDRRWEDAYNKGQAYDKARTAYKSAKKAQNKAIREKTRELNKNASFGEKLAYSDGTRRRAANYIVKNNMSVEEATKRAQGDARRNTAVFVAAYGAITLASIYAANR